MLRLKPNIHFDFRIKSVPGDYFSPNLKVEIRPEILEWMTNRNITHTIHQTNHDDSYYRVIEIDIELCSSEAEMLFKLTWL